MRESRYNVWVEKGASAYVFNALSGSLLRMGGEDRGALRAFLSGQSSDCPPKILAHLAAGYMLIPDDADELELLRRRYASSRNDTSRLALTLVTSFGCNFDCPYCFEEKHPSIMDREVQSLVLDLLDEQLPRIENFHVTWFGGEPLVGKRSLLALSDGFIERCDRAGVAYDAGIITNGYYLDAETCAELATRRVRFVQIGLDGPPDVHDRMRPLANGKGSFATVLRNLHHAVGHFSVSVRVNVDKNNIERAEELFSLLSAEGLSGKLSVYPAQLVDVKSNQRAPSASYCGCLTNREFADAERSFLALASAYGLAAPSVPASTGAPCTAVRANELIIGSKGELYKCWNNVGDSREVIGHIRDYKATNSRLAKWLAYDPFNNDECRSCIALPVCMGGCASHAFDKLQY